MCYLRVVCKYCAIIMIFYGMLCVSCNTCTCSFCSHDMLCTKVETKTYYHENPNILSTVVYTVYNGSFGKNAKWQQGYFSPFVSRGESREYLVYYVHSWRKGILPQS